MRRKCRGCGYAGKDVPLIVSGVSPFIVKGGVSCHPRFERWIRWKSVRNKVKILAWCGVGSPLFRWWRRAEFNNILTFHRVKSARIARTILLVCICAKKCVPPCVSALMWIPGMILRCGGHWKFNDAAGDWRRPELASGPGLRCIVRFGRENSRARHNKTFGAPRDTLSAPGSASSCGEKYLSGWMKFYLFMFPQFAFVRALCGDRWIWVCVCVLKNEILNKLLIILIAG